MTYWFCQFFKISKWTKSVWKIYFRCFCRKAKQFAKKANSPYLLTQLPTFFLHVDVSGSIRQFWCVNCTNFAHSDIWKTLTAIVCWEKTHQFWCANYKLGFRTEKEEIYFGTNFAPLSILKNFDSISMSWISDRKGGNLFWHQFCSFVYFKKL